jgi:DNA replicative helicase MCM subunit Mcm2 (Cdc46/Mcm family)
MEYYPNFEKAAKEFFCQLQGIKEDNFPEFQIELFSQENPKPLREIKSNLLQKMVTV